MPMLAAQLRRAPHENFFAIAPALTQTQTPEGRQPGYDFSFTIAQVISAVSSSYGNNPYPKPPTNAKKFLPHAVVLALAVT